MRGVARSARMKRDIRVKIEYVVTVDDDKIGAAIVDESRLLDLIEQVCRVVTPSAATLQPGAKISTGLTRASSHEVRRASKGSAP